MPSAFLCFQITYTPTPNIKNKTPNMYSTPILIPEAILVSPSAKDVSAAALHVAH